MPQRKARSVAHFKWRPRPGRGTKGSKLLKVFLFSGSVSVSVSPCICICIFRRASFAAVCTRTPPPVWVLRLFLGCDLYRGRAPSPEARVWGFPSEWAENSKSNELRAGTQSPCIVFLSIKAWPLLWFYLNHSVGNSGYLYGLISGEIFRVSLYK